MSLEKKQKLYNLKKNNQFKLQASTQELIEIGDLLKDLNVLLINDIVAYITIEKENDNLIILKIEGTVSLIQECGYTLEEIENKISLNIIHHYKIAQNGKIVLKEIFNKDNYEEEILEELNHDIINLKSIIIEEITLLVNPYFCKQNLKINEYIEDKNTNNPFEGFIMKSKL